MTTITEALDWAAIPHTFYDIPGYGTPGNDPNGWRPFKPIGIIVHYPVGIDDVGVDSRLQSIIDGRVGAPSPIYQIYIDHLDGSVAVLSNGRANHAGGGMSDRWSEAKADVPPTLPSGPDDMAGNEHWYGITLEGPPTTAEQRAMAAKVCAAICITHGWTHNRVIGHREWSPYDKIDPDFSMVWFRDQVEGEMELTTVPQDVIEVLAGADALHLQFALDEAAADIAIGERPTSSAHSTQFLRALATYLGVSATDEDAIIAEMERRFVDTGSSDTETLGMVIDAFQAAADSIATG